MKTIHFFKLVLFALIVSSCSNDDDGNKTSTVAVETETVSNLHAPQSGGQGQPVSGDFSKFDIENGTTTTSTTEWDIAFRGTTIIINGGNASGLTDEPERTGNGGVYITNGTFSGVTSVAPNSFEQDSENGLAITTGSDNGWYNYAGPPSHLITPISGKILVVRTRNGKYAKIEILSYYKDAPNTPDASVDESRYYTFNFTYQPNAGVTTF